MNLFRRSFLQKITAAGVANLALAKSSQTKSVTYFIKGFTCVTCAVGLEVMLRQEKGVVEANASYPGATVHIEFDPQAVSEQALQHYIAGMGFSAASEGR